MKKETIEALANAVKGLQFTSETDAEMVPFFSEDAPVVEMTLQEFLEGVTGTPPEEIAVQVLTDALAANLTDIKVFKISEPGNEAEKVVYLFGKTKDGYTAGLITKAVET